MQGSVVMENQGGSPEMNFRGNLTYQSTALASELEARILTARMGGQPSPVFELEVTLDNDRTGTLTIEVLDESVMMSDAGTSYRCHRLPYGEDEINEVTLLIPAEPEGKKALVSVSY